MTEKIRTLRPQIEALCHRHHVRRLELFGSAATGNVGPDSDVDLLVDFAPLGGGQYAEHFFALKSDLEALLRRRPANSSMRLEVRKYLFDIEQAAARLNQFVDGKTLDAAIAGVRVRRSRLMLLCARPWSRRRLDTLATEPLYFVADVEDHVRAFDLTAPAHRRARRHHDSAAKA